MVSRSVTGSDLLGDNPTVEAAATLLEREPELAEFGNALSDARDGRGRVVLVEAPAGLGKTSLLGAAAEMAADAGFTCLRARASELERDFAYGCMRQLLEPGAATLSGPERERRFEGAAAFAEPLFAPAGVPGSAPSSADSAFSVLHGLYWLLNNLTDEGPVALLLDDLHWSDSESLRFLNYLAPRLDGLPLAVFASSRRGENVAADLARLAAGPETTLLRPAPLSTGATAKLCEQRLGSPVADEFAVACREATGGNPFYLEALLREASDQQLSPGAREAIHVERAGPAAVAQAVLLRLSGAPAAAAALVRAVAILGNGAHLTEAADLAGIDEAEAVAAADLLVGLAIMRPAEGLEFAHPIVREAVYADIGPHERAEAHARAAALLASGGASEERVAAQIAEAQPAGDPERVELLRRVAADALARGAPAAAAAWLGRALAEPPPAADHAAVLRELGSAELRLAAPGAADHLAAAVELTREPGPLATSVRLLALALTMAGDADGAVEALESAIAVVERTDRESALVLEAELATYAQQAGREARAPAARRLEQRAGLEGATPGERLVLAGLAFERARASESASGAASYIEGAFADGHLLGEEGLDVTGVVYDLMTGLIATDSLDLADACLDRMLDNARARASIPALAFATSLRARCSLRRGAVAQAEADARTALELLTSHGIQLAGRIALAHLVEALVEGGNTAEAEQALRDSGAAEEIPPSLNTNDLLRARGLLHLAQGRTRQGLGDLVEFGRRDELWGLANPLASRWRSRASLALAVLGDLEEARRMAFEDLGRARRWGAASGIGSALRATARVEGREDAVDRLSEAAEVLERSPAGLEHARALTDLGAALRRGGRRAEARGPLQEAVDKAERCGAGALAELARTELLAAGGRSSDPTSSGLERLTVSERRVAELAAEGRSNPEIAQTLFVTRKTVETHLGHIYRKLDIAGRGELPRALRAPSEDQ